MGRKTPSYVGLRPASEKASAAARGSSRKQDTKPEVELRRLLWREGLRYRKNVSKLPGKPDIVFVGPKVAVFCDGDFWHGKDWKKRKAKLKRGNNSGYWVAKIQRNIDRDRENTAKLEADGWLVLRFWESYIRSDPDAVASEIKAVLARRSRPGWS